MFVDIQERLFPHMEDSEELLERTGLLVKGMQILKVPLLHTEQYPKGLGPTIPELGLLLEGERAVEKIAFSCCDEPVFMDRSKLSYHSSLVFQAFIEIRPKLVIL